MATDFFDIDDDVRLWGSGRAGGYSRDYSRWGQDTPETTPGGVQDTPETTPGGVQDTPRDYSPIGPKGQNTTLVPPWTPGLGK